MAHSDRIGLFAGDKSPAYRPNEFFGSLYNFTKGPL
jgi:hypothetical protein